MSRDADTIFALSSAPGRAGVAVVRMSGRGSGPALDRLTGQREKQARIAILSTISDQSGNSIDQALVLWFPGPRSYTGEDLAEVHLHGGRAVVEAVLEALAACPGLRPADPGEFTRRAFDNGKLDLSEVEGLADLIAAETEAQRRQAFDQMTGGLSRRVGDWRDRLVSALARLEAAIDFADEGLPAGLEEQVRRSVVAVSGEVAAALASAPRGERLRSGYQIAVLGPPNVGKSSLLNALAQRDVAIVSDQPGTTRDVIEVHLDLAGFPVTVADTAGLREGQRAGQVEQEGMRRSEARAEASDLKIVMGDLTRGSLLDPVVGHLADQNALVVFNKSDLAPPAALSEGVAISAETGDGLDDLLALIRDRVESSLQQTSGAPMVTRIRHRRALEDCRDALARAGTSEAVELCAEDLRLAVRALGRIAGTVDVEDLLDLVFAEFCIGK